MLKLFCKADKLKASAYDQVIGCFEKPVSLEAMQDIKCKETIARFFEFKYQSASINDPLGTLAGGLISKGSELEAGTGAFSKSFS